MSPVFLLAYEFWVLKPFKKEIHTEIRAFGNDYWFETDGPKSIPSRNKEFLPYDGSDYTLATELSCGSTMLTKYEFESYIDDIAFEFRAEKYLLVNRSCRNYSKDLLSYLHPTGDNACRKYLSDLADDQDFKEKMLAGAALLMGALLGFAISTGDKEDKDEL